MSVRYEIAVHARQGKEFLQYRGIHAVSDLSYARTAKHRESLQGVRNFVDFKISIIDPWAPL